VAKSDGYPTSFFEVRGRVREQSGDNPRFLKRGLEDLFLVLWQRAPGKEFWV
jgi:hypothetical protein